MFVQLTCRQCCRDDDRRRRLGQRLPRRPAQPHPLPVPAYLHPAVSLVAPQVYPAVSADLGKEISWLGAHKRLQATRERWQRYPLCREELRPGKPSWAIYGQLWGHSATAVAWLADQAQVYLGWSIPDRSQSSGLEGLRLALRLRQLAGPAPGAVARAQRQLGLEPDGIPGALTAAALNR